MTTNAISQCTTEESTKHAQMEQANQYALWQILGIWLVAGSPMWLIGWGIYPLLSAGLPPMDAGLLRMELMTIGLIWQFVLSLIIVYREEGNLRLSTIRRRLWLNHPVSASTGETRKALWWWIMPLILLAAFLGIVLTPMIDNWKATALPFLSAPQGYDFGSLFSPGMRAHFVGAWGLLGLFFVNALFNTVLGEEFLFRGVLLPRMQGVFGKWDWVANGLMFSLYHLHQPWGILAAIPQDLVFAFSGKRFRSTWFPIILHSGQSAYILFLLLGLVLGWA